MSKFSIQYDNARFSEKQNDAIAEALELAVESHGDQLRASGKPYVSHPIAVAEIVASWGLDHESVMAAILHDVVEDTPVELGELQKRFGSKVAELVDGVTKLRLSSSPRPAEDSPRLEVSNENLRKLLLATTKDYRVIMIKLADRLHNMRTLEYLEEPRRSRIARESLQVYAPLADRLGMGQLKGELEDLGFKYSQPEEYIRLEKLVRATAKKAQRYLAVLKRVITGYLGEAGVEVISIEARQKHIYSIHKKMVKTGGDIDKIYDLIAVRVIVPDVAACYQALGVLHQHYRPLIHRIKDYIAVPKPNGYQSLHTTVFAEDGHISEIQIRTPEMHDAAEHGLAAHFYYDAQKTTKAYTKRLKASERPDSLKWVKELSELRDLARTGEEFVDGVKLELFGDRIFVFSPKGDLYELPEGATPLDFAFAVHSDLGLRALGAKVNGRMVTLDSRLENRDVVEMVTRRESAPSRDWLGVVVTSHAKSRIRAWFKAASRGANIASGRAALEAALPTWGFKRIEDLPKRAMADTIDGLHVRGADDLFVGLGDGSYSVANVIRRLIPNAAKPQGVPVVKRSEPTGRILVEGKQLPYTLAACCVPIFPQPLIGYVTRGKGITVHALGCRNLPTDTERYTTCRWETEVEAPELLVCRLELMAGNRIGLISDITGAVAAVRLNIGGITSSSGLESGPSRVEFTVEVPDLFILASLVSKLERIKGVISVKRVA